MSINRFLSSIAARNKSMCDVCRSLVSPWRHRKSKPRLKWPHVSDKDNSIEHRRPFENLQVLTLFQAYFTIIRRHQKSSIKSLHSSKGYVGLTSTTHRSMQRGTWQGNGEIIIINNIKFFIINNEIPRGFLVLYKVNLKSIIRIKSSVQLYRIRYLVAQKVCTVMGQMDQIRLECQGFLVHWSQ